MHCIILRIGHSTTCCVYVFHEYGAIISLLDVIASHILPIDVLQAYFLMGTSLYHLGKLEEAIDVFPLVRLLL
jgi:hypothetical protein